MPELPDVEGFKQYFDRTTLHKRVEGATVLDVRLLHGMEPEQFVRRLKGRRFEASHRHGKHLFALLDDGSALAMHFGMTGLLQLYGRDEAQPRFTCVAFEFDNGSNLAYVNRRRLGAMRLVDDVDQFVAEQQLGPDALDQRLDGRTYAERVRGRRSAIKSVLMNQEIVAGIGNVWADDILFQARLHPQKNADELDDKTLRELHRIMRRVLSTGARHGGDVDALPRGYLLPHREEGECPRCGGAIRKMTLSGRSTYFCPKCQ